MKTLVVALDAFDIRYCPKKYLDKITQKKFGTYDVSILERIFTPICFSAILTGKDPREFEYTSSYIEEKYSAGYRWYLRPFYWIRRNLFWWIKSLGLRKKMVGRGLLNVAGVDRNMGDHMKDLTIFRELEKRGYSLLIPNVPSYSQKLTGAHVARMIGKPLSERIAFVDKLIDTVYLDWKFIINNLTDYDFFFYYSKLPDEAHHILAGISEYRDIVKYTYEKLCNLPLLFELKNVAILLLSDHGYTHKFNIEGKEILGEHSSLGFWSLNVDTEIEPRTVLDFYDLFIELVEM